MLTLLIHDSLTRLIVQVVAITVISRLIGRLTRRLGQPLVIAEMLGGIVLGPSLLGWLAPALWAEIFTPQSIEVLGLVSQFGLILFMFLVGLELDSTHFTKRTASSMLIAQSGILAPFVVGNVLALWMYPRYSSPATSRLAFVLFTGTAMSVTAFPVLARILAERRLLTTRVGTVAITCAAIADVTAWCILAFMIGVARNSDIQGAALTTAEALGYIALMFGAVRPVLAGLARRVADPAAMTQSMVGLLVVLLLISSWATEMIGVHGLFGGFLFGVILPKDRGFARELLRRLEDLVVVVLLPLFFASSGLHTQIGLLSSRGDWAVCGLVVLAACIGKIGGCAGAARITGFGWRDAGAIGVLMNTRGLMELIVLKIGLDLGVISPTVFSMMVVMALTTTFVASPLLRWLVPPQ